MPTKIAALYDIHGNLAALDAVLQEVERSGVDAMVFGVDLTWGPQPRQVMERVMSLRGLIYFVRGNADREVAECHGVQQGVDAWIAEINAWCHDQLTPDQIRFLLNQKDHVTLCVDGAGRCPLCPRIAQKRRGGHPRGYALRGNRAHGCACSRVDHRLRPHAYPI
ncbi:metallophosphoesterase family protein [Alicyclobacillus sendaiensis]|uniref:metallophosphoesterase family protein n=1 Tax=Alicyclobacillus sendaiensis TaxID=192387 RepID=UPI00272A4D8D|nr:metallophosphoesterase [Alicyclobacillus sendaiensis]